MPTKLTDENGAEWTTCVWHEEIMFSCNTCPMCAMQDSHTEGTKFLRAEIDELNNALDDLETQAGTTEREYDDFRGRCVCGQLAND